MTRMPIREKLTWNRRDVLALAILVLGVTLFHLRGLWPGYAFMPVDLANNTLPWRSGPAKPVHNPLVSDPLYQFYPALAFDVNTLRYSQSLPLWDPSILLGHPVVANPPFQPFYPVFATLGIVFGVARGLTVGLWLHALLAGALMYGFLRTITGSRPAAVLGAFTYALGGYMVTWFETTFWVTTLSWLPGVLWTFELALRRRSLRYVGLSALTMSLAILGGEFRFALTFMLFLGIYALGRVLVRIRRRTGGYHWPLVVLGGVIIVATLLSAIQTVPFAEFLPFSHRATSRGLRDPLPSRQLMTLIAPDFYGDPRWASGYWGAGNFGEATIYAGLPALLLACVAPFCARRLFVWCMSLALILTLWFVVGGPGVRVLGSIPIVKYLSLHRAAFLLPLLISVLAAMAVSAQALPSRLAVAIGCLLASVVGLAVYLNWGSAQEHWQVLQRSILWAVSLLFFVVLFVALRAQFPNARRWANWGIVALVFVDLFAFGNTFNPVGPIAELVPPTPAIDYLRARAGLHRVVAYQPVGDVLYGPNILPVYGVTEAGGYSTVIPARFHELVGTGDPTLADVWSATGNRQLVLFFHPSTRLLDLLQVGHVVSALPLHDPGVRAEFVLDGCERDSGEITSSSTVTGFFTVRDTAINRLDLRFRVYRPGQSSGTLLVRMWRGLEKQRLILESRLNTRDLQDQGNVTLYFAPEREAPGQTYVWEVVPDGPARETGVALCALADGHPAISVYGADWSQVYQGEVYVFERLSPMPRAYVVYAAEHIADDEQAVGRLLDESFDLRNVAVVAEPVHLPSKPENRASPAEIVRYEDTRVVVEASAAQQGLLVLGDQFCPGWQAYLDGEAAQVVRVNHVMRGVFLPAGEHEVVFEFAPGSLRTGGLLSLLGVLGVVSLFLVSGHNRLLGWLSGTSERGDETGPGV